VRSQLDFTPNLAPSLLIAVFDVALLATAAWLIGTGNLAAFLLSQLLIAVVFFNSFGLLHECGHGTASSSSAVNTLLGHWTSTFCFIPYYPWKYIHQKHHAWTGNLERDPVLKSLRRWRDAGVPPLVGVAWRSWIPLGALLQHVVYWSYPIAMARAGEMTREKLLRTIASFAWLGVGYALLWRFAPVLAAPSGFGLGFLLYLIAEELVNIPHHADVSTAEGKLPIWEQYRATRSCVYPRGLSELLVLNFNFHTEHHLFPSLPWYRLRTARALLKVELGGRYQEAVGIRWNIEGRARSLDSIVARYRQAG
jgi:omega-6 fatty acid desaturase (delta-12 desaturase)